MQDQWQPIASAPKDGSTFITYSPNASNPYDFASWEAEYEDFCKHGCGFQYATHWMPMIPPPEDRGG